MLTDLLYSVSGQGPSLIAAGLATLASNPLTLVLAVCLTTLLLWRFWTFTILPRLRPNEPKELPYWLPFVGHAVDFVKDSHGLITYGRRYFNNTRKPFALTVAGETLYIITSPEDVTAAYKNTASLTMDDFLQTLMEAFAVTPRTIARMWAADGKDGSKPIMQCPNPSHKCPIHVVSDFYKHQLHPGEGLDQISSIICGHLVRLINWDYKDGLHEFVVRDADEYRDVSLLRWCGEVLLDAGTRSFFGHKLLEIEPDFFKHFLQYDDSSWKLMFRVPRIFSKDMHAGKDKVLRAMTAYLALPKANRPNAAWLIDTIDEEYTRLGISCEDRARLIMPVYWVINTNSYKLAFWVLTYLLHDRVLLAHIRNETAPAITGDKIDMTHLLARCPLLNATLNETLRLTDSAASARAILAPTVIGGLTLRKGTKLVMPYRQLHLNREEYGDDVNQFNPKRFIERKNLERSQSYRPFGGGTTYCPGRFIARHEILAYVALTLARFDVELAPAAPTGQAGLGGQRFPLMDEVKPAIGIMAPVPGHDIIMRMRPRS